MAMKQFDLIKTPELLAIILKGTKRSDEALYYLLNKRLKRLLKSEYMKYTDAIDDTFEDTINEYYLYLHDYGRNEADSKPCYPPLIRIKESQHFASWIIRTYRFFLTGMAKRMMITPLYDNLPIEQPTDSVKYWERRIWDMSVLIIYAYQNLTLLSRFIFFRSMLKVMDKKRCIPDQLMAQTLGISYINYRVHKHHAWQKVRNSRKRMLEGERIKLDTARR